jgi:hypothetical protein
MTNTNQQPKAESAPAEVGALCLECGEPVERNEKKNLLLGAVYDSGVPEDEVWIHKACASELMERLERCLR